MRQQQPRAPKVEKKTDLKAQALKAAKVVKFGAYTHLPSLFTNVGSLHFDYKKPSKRKDEGGKKKRKKEKEIGSLGLALGWRRKARKV